MKISFTKLFPVWVLCICFTLIGESAASDYDTLKKEAEDAFAEGSYQRAHELYQQVDLQQLSGTDLRWVQFRLADTALRSSASSRQRDDSAYRAAKDKLEEFIAPDSVQDVVWAKANEALADAKWLLPRDRNWSAASPRYEAALQYWAASTNLTTAREQYLGMVRKMATIPDERNYYYGYWGNLIPVPILENALKIAQSEDDKAHFHYLLAMALRQQRTEWEQRIRVPKEFEAAIQPGKKTSWYDDALYFYAEWMGSNSLAVREDNGTWHFEADYAKALELYRRLIDEYGKEESRWHDAALNQIEQITKPRVNVSVSNVFLPGSEIEYFLGWRNVENVQLTLHKVDLTKAVVFDSSAPERTAWLDAAQLSQGKKIKTWTRQTKATHPHEPGGERLLLDEKLEKGAYILEATSEGAKSREIILVTDIAIVSQVVNGHYLFYVANSATGAPIADAKVVFWNRYFQNPNYGARKYAGETDTNGIVSFEVEEKAVGNDFFVSAISGSSQAFDQGNQYFWSDAKNDSWKIYAVTDRPAYRPGETVHWKFTAREMEEMGKYSVPDGKTIRLKIYDPRGTEIYKSDLKLNSFGSAWGDLNLKTNLPLGEFRVQFLSSDGLKTLGNATLFRMEEYKLPEFKVSIHVPEENGRKKTFLLGEKIEVEIEAEYYFGGPVANANVEAVVRQRPFYHIFDVEREYPWFYDSGEFMRRRPIGSNREVQRETIKTDENGKARFTIQTPFGENDMEYLVEARVTDASRREITASDSIRVSTQRFYVDVRPEHNIYHPQDKVEVTFKARDINEQPVQAEGIVTVTRDLWFEIWLDPTGREVKGDELTELQRAAIFPPRPRPGEKDWRLKFRGYSHDQILTKTLKTGTNGLATLSFTPGKEGYYRIAWRTDESPAENQIPSRPVTGETTVWVATQNTTELGYHPGGIQIIVDKDTFKAGQKAPVMLSAPGNDRYVLFTVSAGNFIHYQLVHMEGSAKLIELSIGENFIPNVFLNAASIQDQNLLMDNTEVIVPPVKQFLDLDVIAAEEQLQPGETGHLTLKVRDREGKPVSAELALSVFDESLLYIQSDLTEDPRKFFFGEKRKSLLVTGSSFGQKNYRKTTRSEAEVHANAFLQEGTTLGMAVASEEKQELLRYRGLVTSGAMFGNAMPASVPALSKATAMDSVDVAARSAIRRSAVNTPEDQVAPDEPVQVRSDFRTSIFWQPDIKTGADGTATIEVKYPDSLTSWQSVAQAVTSENQFGIGRATTRTQKPLIARLQAPRFFVVGDTVTISAVINNNTDEAMTVTPALEVSGIEQPKDSERESVKIPAHSEKRIDWTVQPGAAGDARLKVTARGGKFSDAMEKSYPVFEHGIEKFVSLSGKSNNGDVHATLELPTERRPGSTRMSVQVTPSIAVTMLDALPYLINYPYGCTEQTMSRFLPTVITAQTLKQLKLDPKEMLNRVFGGIESTNASATHPGGKQDLEKLDEMVKSSLERLYDFQHGDGGWGWWKEGESDRFMTAYALWGMALAREAGINIRNDALSRAANYLDQNLANAESDYPMQAWMLHALADYARVIRQNKPSEPQEMAFANLWKNRDRLNAYSRALFALAAQNLGKKDEARTLARNLANGVKMDKNPGASVLTRNAGGNAPATAHWGEDGFYWRWSEGGVEATAFALRALLEIDPKNELIHPVVNWLVKNRRGAQWSNTRDTAIVVLALNDYLKTSGELDNELEFEVLMNDQPIARKKIAKSDLLQAPSRFEIPEVQSGKNEITIRRISGEAPIYYSAEAAYFSTEEPITPAGNEIFVKRQYYKLAPIPTLLNGYAYQKQLITGSEKIESGDRIETVITIEAKNNYEYLLFEDLKPAGLEAVQVQSGEPILARQLRSAAFENKTGKPAIGEQRNPDERGTGHARSVYQELRDRKVALFIDKLPEGLWEIRYELRAEIPGAFHALPVTGHAMYVPEIRANGAETRLRIIEEQKK